jgi:hypothetical protein
MILLCLGGTILRQQSQRRLQPWKASEGTLQPHLPLGTLPMARGFSLQQRQSLRLAQHREWLAVALVLPTG